MSSFISKGGDYTIPPGSGAAPDYVVILNSTDPVTIHGAPNSSIWGGGGGQVTIIDPATITLSEGAGNAVVTLPVPATRWPETIKTTL